MYTSLPTAACAAAVSVKDAGDLFAALHKVPDTRPGGARRPSDGVRAGRCWWLVRLRGVRVVRRFGAGGCQRRPGVALLAECGVR